jgi:outer membrane protein assembly factor BamB
VAVDQGVAYFTSGFFPHEGVFLCAVDAITGTQTTSSHWQRKIGGVAALQGYILLSATKIFMPGSRSTPYYFDRATGSTLGQYSGAMGTYALLAGNSFFYGPAARGGGQITEGGLAGDTIASYNSGNAIVVTATRTYLLGDTTLSALDRTTRTTVWTKSANYPYALILAGTTLFAGGENEVAAFDSATGNKTWSSPVNGSAYGMAVANGRLFVSTDTGYIYSFVQDQSSKQSTWMLY